VLVTQALAWGNPLKKKIQLQPIRTMPSKGSDKLEQGRFEQTANQILKIDNFFIETRRTAALRPDARLLFYIMVKHSVSIKEAMLDSSLSYRAFYTMLDRLKGEALLDVESDDEDRRVRRLVLGRQFDRIMGKLPHF
jgi:DNA-binding MarR family transcriptional regulator